MALRSQKAVLANLDRMAGRRIRRMSRAYREKTLGPLAAMLERSGTAQEALSMLNGGLLRQMDTVPLADAIEQHEVQTQCIGRATALRGNQATRQEGT